MTVETDPVADMGCLAVVRVRPAYQQAADQLRDLVLDGSLMAGDRLPPEGDLAAQFGVSRSTLREALRLLASRDIIRTARGPRGGTFVAQVRADGVSDYLETSLGLMSAGHQVSVEQMLEARDLLEVPAARLAALKRDRTHLSAMADALQRERGSGGRAKRFVDHRSFHQTILDASGNVLLGMMNEPLFRVLQARFVRSDVSGEFWLQVDEQHADILSAVTDGDSDRAGDLMASHLLALREAYTL